MNCLCCGKKLRGIREDRDYQNWQRKYHKNCFNDRNIYYEKLALADLGTEAGIKTWCEYVLTGLKEEVEKIDKLLNYDFLKSEILIPAIQFSLEMN